MEKEKKSVIVWQVVSLILFIACLVVGFLLVEDRLEASRAKSATNAALQYINKYVLVSSTKAVLSSGPIKSVNIGRLYKFTIDINTKSDFYVTPDGKYVIPASEMINITKEPSTIPSAIANKNQVDADEGFKMFTDGQFCEENGKPLVYFFGLTTSADSAWEYPIFKDVVSRFGDAVSFHDNYLSENGLDKDQGIFSTYSTGTIPVLVIGCKYYRVGSGESQGEAAERATLTKLICDVTGNQPASVCKAK